MDADERQRELRRSILDIVAFLFAPERPWLGYHEAERAAIRLCRMLGISGAEVETRQDALRTDKKV